MGAGARGRRVLERGGGVGVGAAVAAFATLPPASVGRRASVARVPVGRGGRNGKQTRKVGVVGEGRGGGFPDRIGRCGGDAGGTEHLGHVAHGRRGMMVIWDAMLPTVIAGLKGIFRTGVAIHRRRSSVVVVVVISRRIIPMPEILPLPPPRAVSIMAGFRPPPPLPHSKAAGGISMAGSVVEHVHEFHHQFIHSKTSKSSLVPPRFDRIKEGKKNSRFKGRGGGPIFERVM